MSLQFTRTGQTIAASGSATLDILVGGASRVGVALSNSGANDIDSIAVHVDRGGGVWAPLSSLTTALGSLLAGASKGFVIAGEGELARVRLVLSSTSGTSFSVDLQGTQDAAPGDLGCTVGGFPLGPSSVLASSPGTDNALDLGDATHQWRTLYLGTSLRAPVIKDTNGAVSITIGTTSSAVNGLVVTNSASTNPVQLSPGGTGSGSNLALYLHGKGTGGCALTKVDGSTKLVEVNQTGVGFFGASPIAQPAMIADVASQDVGGSFNQTNINAAINAVGAKINAINAQLKLLGLIASS